jgi:hypothetical protein
LPAVSGNKISFTVAIICAELDAEDTFTCDFVFLEAAEEFGRLARKHGSHYQLDAPALVEGLKLLEVFFVGFAVGKNRFARLVLVERTVNCV